MSVRKRSAGLVDVSEVVTMVLHCDAPSVPLKDARFAMGARKPRADADRLRTSCVASTAHLAFRDAHAEDRAAASAVHREHASVRIVDAATGLARGDGNNRPRVVYLRTR